jgi:hypothetical protein
MSSLLAHAIIMPSKAIQDLACMRQCTALPHPLARTCSSSTVQKSTLLHAGISLNENVNALSPKQIKL